MKNSCSLKKQSSFLYELMQFSWVLSFNVQAKVSLIFTALVFILLLQIQWLKFLLKHGIDIKWKAKVAMAEKPSACVF